MLHHFLAPLRDLFLPFNLFNYISFRAAGAMVTALLIAFLTGPAIIARLRELKVGQVIRADGPATHQGKRGTPTMGGIIIVAATVIPALLWTRLDNRFVIITLIAMVSMAGIGMLDDWLKVMQGQSRGLVAEWKLAGQVTFGVLLALVLLKRPLVNPAATPRSATTVAGFKYLLVIFSPWLYLVFVTGVGTGFSNAVNLTD